MNEPNVQALSSAKLSVRVVDNANDIETLRSAWEQMQWHPNGDIDYFLMVARASKQKPFVLAVSRQQEVVAIAAARIAQTTLKCSIGYKTIFAPQVAKLTLVHGGLMGEITEEVACLIVKRLSHALKERVAEVASFDLIRTASPLFAQARCGPRLLCRDFVPKLQGHHALALPKTREELFSNLNSKHRSSLKRLPKLLERDFPGQIRTERFCSVEEASRFCSVAEAVAEKSYLRAIGVGFVNNEAMRRAVQLFAARGQFLGHVMFIGAKPCAFWCGNLYGREFYIGLTAFDPQYRKYEIGRLLLTKLIEDIFNQRQQIDRIDFGPGDGRYKAIFGNETWQESTVNVFAPTARIVGINMVRTPLAVATDLAQRALKRSGLEERLKRIWRARATKILSA